jgi:hypothetical protein
VIGSDSGRRPALESTSVVTMGGSVATHAGMVKIVAMS